MNMLFTMQRTQDSSPPAGADGSQKMMQMSSYEAQWMVRMFVEERHTAAIGFCPDRGTGIGERGSAVMEQVRHALEGVGR